MKTFWSLLLFLCLGATANAQFTKATLQASGLTCSMCSKAVLNALKDVPFVDKVGVDIKNQQYNLSFKNNAAVSFDALKAAVEDAGFSVAGLKVTAAVQNLTAEKDSHVKIGNQYFHFLNAKDQQLNGNVTFSIVDKQFVTDKQYKKYSTASKMECVQTGRAGKCCTSDNIAANTRVYHAII
jgi:copper chaperone CopZ